MSRKDTPVTIPVDHAGRLIRVHYASTGPFQWAREVWKNSEEAGATKMHFGFEWQGVESKGVYRRYAADNGCGMDGDELVYFFSRFGESSKSVGGLNDNLGIGAKLCLMPWNPDGIAVVSWKDGEANMIFIRESEDGDGFGLRTWEAFDEDGNLVLTNVVEPYADPELGIDFAEVGPDWLREEGGTIFVLFGSDEQPDSILGDPTRPEATLKGLAQYMNTRVWSFNGTEVSVEEFTTDDRELWPKSYAEAKQSVTDDELKRRWQERRFLRGARYFAEAEGTRATVTIEEKPMEDASVIRSYLRSEKPTGGEGYSPPVSYVAFLYRGELYDVKTHHAYMRSFGVFDASVYSRLCVVVELPDDNTLSTTPDRKSLIWSDGRSLELTPWADAFAGDLPEKIREELKKAVIKLDGDSFASEEHRKALADRYGPRLRQTLIRVAQAGKERLFPTIRGSRPHVDGQPVTRVRTKKARSGKTGTSGTAVLGRPDRNGTHAGEKTKHVQTDLPPVEIIEGEQDDAVWMTDGTIYLAKDHDVIQTQIVLWQEQYPAGTEGVVEDAVLRWYSDSLSLRVAHIDSLKAAYTEDQRAEMKLPAALTASLLGLIADDYVLNPVLGAKLGARRKR